MTSIRTHTGPVYLCSDCGQPAGESEFGDEHFDEQWDGIHCPWFPLAGKRLVVDWNETSLEDLRDQYPDTSPRGATPEE